MSTLEKFCQLWPMAQKQGPPEFPIRLTVHPPIASEMAKNRWAARYHSLDFGTVPIWIPHWFEIQVSL